METVLTNSLMSPLGQLKIRVSAQDKQDEDELIELEERESGRV
jgi:hypothetical protein